MQIGYLKGCKPKIIKQIVLLVSICYLLSPLQNQIIGLLHSISHGIEMPKTFLSHNEESTTIHNEHNHNTTFSEHDHQFIDLVDSLFEASNEDSDQEENVFNKIKVKKHITSPSIELPLDYCRESIKKYFTIISQLKKGYPINLEFPPNHLLS